MGGSSPELFEQNVSDYHETSGELSRQLWAEMRPGLRDAACGKKAGGASDCSTFIDFTSLPADSGLPRLNGELAAGRACSATDTAGVRARLESQWRSQDLTAGELKKVAEHMDKFERRAREGGLSPSEVAETYRQISRLLQPRWQAPRMASGGARLPASSSR